MQRQKVTCMIVVPLFLKLISKNIQSEVAKLPAWKRMLFRGLMTISPLLPEQFRRVAFNEIHTRFGGELKFFACGGAPLDVAQVRFFSRLGIRIFQGYGMAEASPVITTNAFGHNKPGSVGRPLPEVEISIVGQAGHGEILTRGPHVMKGYFNRPDLTRQVIDHSGWLHTGDIGYIDEDGYLFVDGRMKNIIVLGSGKKVQPEELEALPPPIGCGEAGSGSA